MQEGGGMGGSRSPNVCGGLLFIQIKSINQTVFSKEVLTWRNKKKENVLQSISHYCMCIQSLKTTAQLLVLYITQHTEIGLKKEKQRKHIWKQ